ncbi:MAG: ABC transporter ATP-binding protein [Desulfofustis sp.]|jgi:zinc transport system ATP-binding protein|nr:ABC transporter ATP-binding protein [Desulfofustis sp.]
MSGQSMPHPAGGQPIVEINDLCFSYSGKEVLHGIDLVINIGDFVAVVGPNGGGKTTLLKLVIGLLRPTRGSVKLAGGKPGSREGKLKIGYVPQQINHNLNFPATALDVVIMGKHVPDRRFSFGRGDKDREDGLSALAKMGITDLAHRRISALSGGQRQRVLISRALVSRPDLLVLDEPTASIDSRGQSDFYALLKELNEELTILMVSHDLLSISSVAKSVACVNRRLHYHQRFTSSGELIDAVYACTVYESCPVFSSAQVVDLRAAGGPGGDA